MLCTSRVTILDYGAGNISSVARFFSNDLGCTTSIVSVEEFGRRRSSVLIIPGVGHFGEAAKRLESVKGQERIREFAKEGNLVIGICLGAQILTLGSEEAEDSQRGVGLIPLYCKSLEKCTAYKGKIPRTGWAKVRHKDHEAAYYFVHSFYLSGANEFSSFLNIDECIEDKVPAYISMNNLNVHAIQFHPEKSGNDGFLFMKEILESA